MLWKSWAGELLTNWPETEVLSVGLCWDRMVAVSLQHGMVSAAWLELPSRY